MIELNEKTQQDFLNREWVQKFLKAGVDMSDAKYYIVKSPDGSEEDMVIYDSTGACYEEEFLSENKGVPTYTVSELLYKLREYSEVPLIDTQISLDNLIDSLASLLIQCHKKDIGIETKDTGDISSK